MDYYEATASEFLQSKGLEIIGENFTWPGGEIDLIALDQGELIFIEVKYRSNSKHGHPLEFITPHKISKLRKTADYYLLHQWQGIEPWVRFDVIGLLPLDNKPLSQNKPIENTENFKSFTIEWIQAAF